MLAVPIWIDGVGTGRMFEAVCPDESYIGVSSQMKNENTTRKILTSAVRN